MVKVVLKEKENIEAALKRFKYKCNRIGVVKECRQRKQYTPESVAKRQKKMHAIYVNKMNSEKNGD